MDEKLKHSESPSNKGNVNIISDNLFLTENSGNINSMSGNISLSWKNTGNITTMSWTIKATDNLKGANLSSMSWNISLKWVNHWRIDSMSWDIILSENFWKVTTKSWEVSINKINLKVKITGSFLGVSGNSVSVSGNSSVVINGSSEVWINGKKQGISEKNPQWFLHIDGAKIDTKWRIIEWSLSGASISINSRIIIVEYKNQSFRFDTDKWNLEITAKP